MLPKWLLFATDSMMKTLTVKNMSEELYTRLGQAAKANRRSLNQQVIFQLEKSTQNSYLTVEDELAELDEFRNSLPNSLWVTDEILAESRAELVRRSERIFQNVDHPVKKGKARVR